MDPENNATEADGQLSAQVLLVDRLKSAADLFARSVGAWIEVQGYVAENQCCVVYEETAVYSEKAFAQILNRYGLGR
jgi:hypothetical protein